MKTTPIWSERARPYVLLLDAKMLFDEDRPCIKEFPVSTFSFCAMILILGHATHVVQEKSEKSLTITPTEFFSGDLKRLKSHVDFKAWCFKIDSPGSLRCRPEIEMWCDGKRVDKGSYGVGQPDSDNELTLSLRTEIVNKEKVYLIRIGGLHNYGRRIKKPKSTQKVEVEFGPVTISKPIEMKSKGESAIVWVMGAGHHDVILGKSEEVEKMLKSAPWVLILRLTVE